MNNCLKVPKSVKTEPLRKGEYLSWKTENLLIVRRKYKKEIYFLLPIHQVNIEKMPKIKMIQQLQRGVDH